MEHAISYFLTPSHGLWLLVIVGWLSWRLAYFEAGRTLAKVGVVGLAISHLTPLGYILILPLEDRFPAPAMPTEVEGIIMLSGAEAGWISNKRGQPLYNDAGERVMATAMLAERYKEAKIIITGSGTDEGLSQAEISVRALIGMGVDADRIAYETTARSTRENAVNTGPMLVGGNVGNVGTGGNDGNGGKWLLVTSAFHMPRAVGVHRKVGIDVTPWPTDYRAHRDGVWLLGPGGLGLNAARTLDRAVHEWLGLLAYRLRGWSDELFPAPQLAE